ncbi:MAG: YlxR family protein [Thermodesulfobacteriota bacterium]|nr:YlxR family protein [Thermodesulfobacteriota bacterium]
MRTCLGCASKKAKRALARLALNPEGQVVWDRRQTMPGRGAYVCPSRDCLAKALKIKKLTRAFRRPVATNLLESLKVPWEE